MCTEAGAGARVEAAARRASLGTAMSTSPPLRMHPDGLHDQSRKERAATRAAHHWGCAGRLCLGDGPRGHSGASRSFKVRWCNDHKGHCQAPKRRARVPHSCGLERHAPASRG